MSEVISFVRRILLVLAVSVGVYFGIESFFDGAGSLVSVGAAICSGTLIFILGWVNGPVKPSSTKEY
jgi:hypothetical protein